MGLDLRTAEGVAEHLVGLLNNEQRGRHAEKTEIPEGKTKIPEGYAISYVVFANEWDKKQGIRGDMHMTISVLDNEDYVKVLESNIVYNPNKEVTVAMNNRFNEGMKRLDDFLLSSAEYTRNSGGQLVYHIYKSAGAEVSIPNIQEA